MEGDVMSRVRPRVANCQPECLELPGHRGKVIVSGALRRQRRRLGLDDAPQLEGISQNVLDRAHLQAGIEDLGSKILPRRALGDQTV